MDCVDLTKISSSQRSWKIDVQGETMTLGNPAQIMAILNVTPDSFSDGGLHNDLVAARTFAESAVRLGASIIDVGGESTRPGSQPVSVSEEIERVVPVIESIKECGAYISIDTSKAEVAEQSLRAGAHIVNDVNAARDPQMFEILAQTQAPSVLMHMQGTPATMQDAPRYENVLDDVIVFFEERLEEAERSGVSKESIILDPGIGFGKTLEQNLNLLQHLDKIHEHTGRPILVGLSRKSFLPKFFKRDLPAQERDAWSHYFHAQIAHACEILRVHDVQGAHDLVATTALFEGQLNV